MKISTCVLIMIFFNLFIALEGTRLKKVLKNLKLQETSVKQIDSNCYCVIYNGKRYCECLRTPHPSTLA